MGVPKFYRWISERYPCLSQIVRQSQIPEFDNFYLDMNGIIHSCSHPNDDDPHFRITEEKIFDDILHYIEFLFRMIKPKKVFFMAVDGVAPRAKMNQQRARRFRTAKDAEMQEKRAKERGEVLPLEERFDSNCITPGTEFMVRLHEQLKYFAVMKISTDKMWRNVKVYLSGHETPGEGEHKIMDFIRFERSQPDYDPNTRHCLYGLDADLIMLGLSTHEPHMAVLREEVVFGWKHPKKARVVPEHTTFHLLHLSLMREYLDFEFSSLKSLLPFLYNLENIIDDWILMGFLVGNDFIPNLPYLHIQKDALQTLYKAYIAVMPTMDGYLNEGGILNLERFEKYLNYLAKYDYEKFNDTYADLKYWEAKTGRKLGNEEEAKGKKENTDFLSCLSHLDDGIDLLSLDEDDEDDEEELFELEFRQHKRNYYMKKLEYENVTPEVLKEQAYCYVRAIQWNLHYYYNGVMSWSWFYPHHYAPYMSDIKGFNDLQLDFEKGKPFLPFQQLLSVLPEACKKLLPIAYQELMSDPESPLKSFYPDDFKTDLNGKIQEWEAVVLIPFINEKLLVDSTLPLESSLTTEERSRNKHGPHLLYTYTEEDLGTYKSSQSDHFSDIDNHARCDEIDENHFRLPVEKIKKGLLENIKIGVYFSGFPTFKHLKFTVELKHERVRVFQAVSSGSNMMITLQDGNEKNLEELGTGLVGKTAFVHWPHLVEAQIVDVNDGERRFYLYTSRSTKKVSLMTAPLNEIEKDQWKKEIESIIERHYERYGIHIGEINIMIRAKTLTGRKYTCATDGKVVLEKQWSLKAENFALQTIVKDIDVHLSPLKEPETVLDLYPVGTSCFMLGHPYYGSMGEVIECTPQEHKGRLRVKLQTPSEPTYGDIMKNEKSISMNHYMPGYLVARQLGISSFLFSRMTGTFLVQTTIPESMSVNKVNIGLNLRFNTRNEEIPGYSKRVEDGTWLYSEKALEVMENYLKEFPELFEKLVTLIDLDGVHITQLFTNEDDGKENLKKITHWLKAQPCAEVERKSCSAKMLDDAVVKAIVDTVDYHKKITPKSVKKYTNIAVKPNLLFCPSDIYGTSPPDANATYKLYDRVISVQANHTVPLGHRGTVIGVEEGEQMCDAVYTVIFDDEFPGGLAMHCTKSCGYKMRPFDLINITHGQRTSPGGQETFKEHYSNRSFHGKTCAEGAGTLDQDYGIKHNEEMISQNKYEQPKQKSWSHKQKNLPPRLQILPRNSPLKRMVPEQPQKLSKTERGQTPVFYSIKSNSPYQQLNHSPHSPFVLQEREENHTFSKIDTAQNFVTPKIMPTSGPPKIVSRTNYQDASLSPETMHSDVNNMEFETLWKGLQQSRDTYPSQQRDLSHVTPAYGRQVSVEELFQGAIKAEVSPTPPSHEENQLQNIMQANQHENSAIKELHNISAKLWNKTPCYKELTAGPMSTCQAEVILPNGRRFSSIVSPNRHKAKESAAEQALAFLKSIPHHKKVLWQPQHQIPVLTQRFASGPRPVLPAVEGQYFYPPSYSVPPSPFPSHSMRNDTFVLRHPPPPPAAFIPDSFVDSNRDVLNNLDSSCSFNPTAILPSRREEDSHTHINEYSQNVSPGRRKERIDFENKNEQIESQKYRSEISESSVENMFVPMQVTKKQSAIKKSLEQKPTSQLAEKHITHEKSTEVSYVENPESIDEAKPNAKLKKRQRKSRLAVKFDSCNS